MNGPRIVPDPPEADRVYVQHAEAFEGSMVMQVGGDLYVSEQGLSALWVASETVPGECPYPGLDAFGPGQAKWFFGREKLTGDLLDILDSSLRAGNGGPVVVVGPSGAGKSSLLGAGLVKALRDGRLAVAGSEAWPILTIAPGTRPLETLVGTVRTCAAALTGRNANSPSDRSNPDSARMTWESALAELKRALGISYAEGPPRRVIIVADQFEELFTAGCDEAERQEFLNALTALTASGPDGPVGLVVLGLRADFYARATEYQVMRAALQSSQLVIGAMTPAEVIEAIKGPARAAGLRLEGGLTERLLRDLGGSGEGADYEAGRLPLLAYALRVTWQRRSGNRLTIAGYEATGGIGGAIAKAAEDVYTGLDASRKRTARQLFLALVQVGSGEPAGEGTPDTRRRVSRERLCSLAADPAAAREVLDVFTVTRLITSGGQTVEITHDALLLRWPRLRQWIHGDRADNLVRQQLEDDATAWDRDNRDTSMLYRGTRLATARSWKESSPQGQSLSAAATAFLIASNRQAHRATRIRRAAVAVLAALALAASTAALYARNENVTVQAQRNYAQSALIAATADALYADKPGVARQVSLAAYELAPSPEAYGSVLNAMGKPIDSQLTNGNLGFNQVAFNADGSMLATGSADAVDLWRINPADPVSPTAAATIRSSRAIKSKPWLWFDPGRSTVLAISYAGWTSFEDANHPYSFRVVNPADISPVAFSGDGRIDTIAVGNGNVELWNTADPANIFRLGHPFRAPGAPSNVVVSRMAISHDGSLLATISGPIISQNALEPTETVRLWNISDPARPRLLPITLTTTQTMLAFSPTRHILATGSADNTVHLWDITNPGHPKAAGPPLSGHTGTIDAMAFTADGNTMATASWDGSVRLWNVSDAGHPAVMAVLGKEPSMVAFTGVTISPDGRLLAATGLTTIGGSLVTQTWLWKIVPGSAVAAEICNSGTSKVITQDQWRQYLPGHAYSPPCPAR
jgi:hypothetical protein